MTANQHPLLLAGPVDHQAGEKGDQHSLAGGCQVAGVIALIGAIIAAALLPSRPTFPTVPTVPTEALEPALVPALVEA